MLSKIQNGLKVKLFSSKVKLTIKLFRKRGRVGRSDVNYVHRIISIPTSVIE